MMVVILILRILDNMNWVHDHQHHHSHRRSAQTLESDLHALTGELGEVDRRLALLRLSLPPAYSRLENIISHNVLLYLDHLDDPNDHCSQQRLQ